MNNIVDFELKFNKESMTYIFQKDEIKIGELPLNDLLSYINTLESESKFIIEQFVVKSYDENKKSFNLFNENESLLMGDLLFLMNVYKFVKLQYETNVIDKLNDFIYKLSTHILKVIDNYLFSDRQKIDKEYINLILTLVLSINSIIFDYILNKINTIKQQNEDIVLVIQSFEGEENDIREQMETITTKLTNFNNKFTRQFDKFSKEHHNLVKEQIKKEEKEKLKQLGGAKKNQFAEYTESDRQVIDFLSLTNNP